MYINNLQFGETSESCFHTFVWLTLFCIIRIKRETNKYMPSRKYFLQKRIHIPIWYFFKHNNIHSNFKTHFPLNTFKLLNPRCCLVKQHRGFVNQHRGLVNQRRWFNYISYSLKEFKLSVRSIYLAKKSIDNNKLSMLFLRL